MGSEQRTVYRAIRALASRMAAFYDFTVSAENVLQKAQVGECRYSNPRKDVTLDDVQERAEIGHARQELANAKDSMERSEERLQNEFDHVDMESAEKTHENVRVLAQNTDRTYLDFCRSISVRLRVCRSEGIMGAGMKASDVSMFKVGIFTMTLCYSVLSCISPGLDARAAYEKIASNTSASPISTLIGHDKPSHSVLVQGYKDFRYVPKSSGWTTEERAKACKEIAGSAEKVAKGLASKLTGPTVRIMRMFNVPMSSSSLGKKTLRRFAIENHRKVFDFGRFHVRYT